MNTTAFKSLILIAAILTAGSRFTCAQSYSVDWFTVDGGGGASTGGSFAVSGTIGQPDAGGPMTGGDFSFTGGFWAIYAVQTAGAPRLTIVDTHTNAVSVSWPSPSTGWTLQRNTNSINSVNWSNVTSGIQDNGTIKYFIDGPLAGNRFYRLKTP